MSYLLLLYVVFLSECTVSEQMLKQFLFVLQVNLLFTGQQL